MLNMYAMHFSLYQLKKKKKEKKKVLTLGNFCSCIYVGVCAVISFSDHTETVKGSAQ